MQKKLSSDFKDSVKISFVKSLPFIIYMFSITAAFRGEMFMLSTSVNTLYINPVYYLSDCFIYDVVVLLIFTSFLMAAARYLKNKQFYVSVALIILIYQNILIFFSGYYMIFETSFLPGSIGSGLTTFWYEILASVLFEIRLRTYAVLVSGLLLIIMLFLTIRHRRAKFHYTVSVLPVLLLIPFFIHSVVISSSLQAKPYPDYSNIVKNPLFIISGSNDTPAETIEASGSDNSMTLSTDSLVDKKMMPGFPVVRKKYNVIFYFAESTYASYTGLKINGKEVTPAWNRLSANSINFNRHYVQYPLSVNAFFNILSSAYTPVGKKWIPMTRPGFKVKSVGEVVKENGYRTALFHTGRLESFNHIDYLKHRKYDLIMDRATLPRNKYSAVDANGLDDRAMIQPSIDFMKKSSSPFFVSYFPVTPHHPYFSAHPELNLYSKSDIQNESNHKTKLWKNYINSLRSADETISELIKRLDENKLLENTIIFIFADHGEAFYQHRGNYLHSLFLYEENVHVPFMIYNKKLFPEKISYDGISRHIDIVPTMLDFIGIDPEPEYEGISLIRPHHQQLAYSHTDWNHEFLSVRDGEWKYIIRSDNKSEELYNIKKDPVEKNNVADTHSDVIKIFRKYAVKAREHQVYYFKKNI